MCKYRIVIIFVYPIWRCSSGKKSIVTNYAPHYISLSVCYFLQYCNVYMSYIYLLSFIGPVVLSSQYLVCAECTSKPLCAIRFVLFAISFLLIFISHYLIKWAGVGPFAIQSATSTATTKDVESHLTKAFHNFFYNLTSYALMHIFVVKSACARAFACVYLCMLKTTSSINILLRRWNQ